MKTKTYSIVAVVSLFFLSSVFAKDWQRKSPFTDVRIQHGKIFVEYKGTLYQLEAIEGIKSDKIIEAAQKEFGSRWEKRVIEDIPEVLEAAGATASTNISLSLRELGTEHSTTIKGAEMTEANRQRIMEKRRGH